MVVVTSIFVAEIKSSMRPGDADPMDRGLPIAERANAFEETPRELISLYEGKNRVEPME